MLKNRIIPCLDVKDGRVVKGVNFTELRDAGDPVEQARLYDEQGADELCFLDITASSDNRSIFYDVVSAVASQCFMPLTVGGGVRSVDDIRKLLLAGADKVSINTAAIKNPQLISDTAEKFGSQCIVVAIDAKQVSAEKIIEPSAREAALHVGADKHATGAKKEYQIFTHGGRENTGIDAVQWAKKVAQLGAGEILLTSMDRDGTKQGVHLDLTKAVSEAVPIPVIASGGIGSLAHFVQAVKEGGADAVLAASVFHYGELTIAQVKEAMQGANIPVRLTS